MVREGMPGVFHRACLYEICKRPRLSGAELSIVKRVCSLLSRYPSVSESFSYASLTTRRGLFAPVVEPVALFQFGA